MMLRALSNKKGFTLIEVVLVIVVTAIAIPTLLLVLGEQARYTVNVEKSIVGSEMAQELMEEIESAGYSSAMGYDGYSDSVTIGLVPYARSVAACQVDASDLDTCVGGSTDYVRVTVSVTTDVGSAELVTVLSNI